MAVTWKLNGTEITLAPVGRLQLELSNQQPDALRFEKQAVAFDTAAAYTSAPTVAITGGGGTGAAGTAEVADGVVSELTLDDGGDDYTSVPQVALEGGGSFGAQAIATLTPTSVDSANVTNGGSGYTSAPTVTPSGGAGTGAEFTAVLAARGVASIALVDGGTGYTSAPTVSLTGGGGTGATAVAVISAGSVTSIAITAGGTGYTSAPTVTLTGGAGTGAVAVAVLTATTLASAALVEAGVGYISAPAVSLAGGGGTGGVITAALTPTPLLGCLVTNGGSGYSTPPTVSFTGGGGSGATAVAVLSSGAVTGVVITAGGSGYTSRPNIAFSGGGGSGAAAVVFLTAAGVGRVLPDQNAFHGWTGTPTVSFINAVGGAGAAATVVMEDIVYGLALTSFGSGYTSRPTVTITGGGGSDAEGWAEINAAGAVIALVLLRHGSGYTSTPTVTFVGGGGSGATAIAYRTKAIVDVTITDAGSGYTIPPSVRFTLGTRIEAGGTILEATSVGAVVISAGGTGYTSAPTVTITGQQSANTRPELYAKVIDGEVDELSIRDIDGLGYPRPLGGFGYSSPPAIAFTGGGGSGAAATASLTGDAVSSVAVTAGGAGYIYPSQLSALAAVAPAGSGATATATLGVLVESITLTNPGSGYTSAPTIGFSGGGGSGATATAVLTPTSLASLAISNAGSGYTSAPTLTIAAPTGVGGVTATATAALTGTSLASVSVTSGGTGYTGAPTVGFTGGGGSGATANATVTSDYIASITVTAAGTGYTSAPSVGFSGGGGSGASATATLATAAVASITVDDGGSDYTAAPSLAISGGGGSGAKASAVLTGTSVASLVLTSNGGVVPFDVAIVLSRDEDGVEEIWFQGVVRELRRVARPGLEAIAYVALGPWQWLERIPFLQTFKQASDPDDAASLLEDYQRGRVVIGQDDDGERVTLGEFLNLVLDYAILAKPGVMQRADFSGLDMTLPWDEVTDLSCAEVITRALQFLPDAVCWWDYAESPPMLHIDRRADMEAIDLAVHPDGEPDSDEYAPLETIELRERADLRKTGVYLLYLATNRSNTRSWEVATPDVYPEGAIASDPDTLFRTIQLAGSVAQSTELQQRVDVDSISSNLVYASSAWLTSGSQFDALRTWWLNHAPDLGGAYVTIKGFAQCSRTGNSVGLAAQLNNELVAGAITDWMEERQNIASEDQTISAYIAFEEARPNDATKKARHIKKFVAVIKATNASTKTYRYLTDQSFEPAEQLPVGLAEAVYGAISVPHFDGAVSLVEHESTRRVLVGRVLNLTGALAAWGTMNALVQQASIDIERGETRLRVGPPRQLGPDDLAQLYRVNRNRLPVTSYGTRATGVTGSGSGGTQGLGRHHRGGARASGVAQAPARYTSAITVAGTVATAAEIAAAILAAYTSDNIPVDGDIVSLTVGGTVKFSAVVTLTAIGTDDWRRVTFTFSSVAYYAWVTQVGIY